MVAEVPESRNFNNIHLACHKWTSWPHRFQGVLRNPGNLPPNTITVEIHFRQPFASRIPNGLVKLNHQFTGDDIEYETMNMKWIKTVRMGNPLKGTGDEWRAGDRVATGVAGCA